MRDDPNILPDARDDATNYTTVIDEMIARCPHGTYEYQQDNATLWHILYDALKDHPSYTTIRRHSRTTNGRDA